MSLLILCSRFLVLTKCVLVSSNRSNATVVNLEFTPCGRHVLHSVRQLTWKTHIKAKGCQLQLKLKTMSWLINTRSQLSLDNKLTVYRAILRPIWTYGVELWGCSKPSNTKILQTFQSKTFRTISNAPWYVSS